MNPQVPANTDWPAFPRLWPKTKIKWLERLHRWLGDQIDMHEFRKGGR